MAETVALTLNVCDGTGSPVKQGTAYLEPTSLLTDPADQILATQTPIAVSLVNGSPVVDLLTTDDPDITPPGWAWRIHFSGFPGAPSPYTFALPLAGGLAQNLSDVTVVQNAVTYQAYLPVPAGTPTAGEVPIATGTGEATTWGPQGSGGGGGLTNPMTTAGDLIVGAAAGVPARLAANGTATRKFLRDVSAGTPAWDTLVAGDVPALPYDASGAAATAQANAQTFATAAVATETTRAQTAEGLLAPLASPAFTGTPTAPTKTPLTNNTDIATTAYADLADGVERTRAQAAEALALAKSANLSDLANAGTARTNLGLGTAAVAAIDTTALDIAPLGTQAAGATGKVADAGHVHPTTSVIDGVTVSGAAIAGNVITATSPTAAIWQTPAGGVTLDTTATDIHALGAQAAGAIGKAADAGHVHPTTGVVTGVTATDGSVVVAGTSQAPTIATGTLDAVAAAHPPAAAWSNNSKKITSLANGSAASDAAAFGQIPTALPPNGSAGGVLSGTYPNPGFATTPLPQSGGTMTGWLAPAVAALTFVGAGTTLVNAALANAFNLTLTASTTTLGNPTNPVDGQVIRFRIAQDATGSRTLAYGTAYDFGAAGAPTLSTAASKVDILAFEYVASLSKWAFLGSGIGY